VGIFATIFVLVEEISVKVWVPSTTFGVAELGLKFCPEIVIWLSV
jgi:hypothetical protein